jgi:hypothetical protein
LKFQKYDSLLDDNGFNLVPNHQQTRGWWHEQINVGTYLISVFHTAEPSHLGCNHFTSRQRVFGLSEENPIQNPKPSKE